MKYRVFLLAGLASTAGLLQACGDDAPDCSGIVCGACESAINLHVLVPGAPDGTAISAIGLPVTCTEVIAGEATCYGDVAPGSYAGTLQADGPFTSPMLSFEVEADTAGGCCSCGYVPYHADVTLTPGTMPMDGGVPTDGGSDDAGPLDAGTPLDAATLDGGPVECRPERVDFPMGGDLTPGTLCDDVFACADDAADAARITAAAPHFECEAGPGGTGRCDAWTCAYRNPGGPSTLDEGEIQEICSLTALEPTPDLVCVVYL